MTISFDLDMADMMSFQKHYVNTAPAMKKAKSLIAYIFPLFILIFGFLSFYSRHSRIDIYFIIIMLIISALWAIFMPKFFVNRTLNRSKKILSKPGNEVMFGKFEMTFNDSDFEVITAKTNSNILWSAIPKVEETENYIYIYLSQVSAYIIPKRKISAEEVENLRTVLKQHLL